MESADIVDEVNELLRLGVGDVFRLEHIKQSYIHNKTLWDSDQKYLADMKEKYLVRIKPPEEQQEESPTQIHCWKCGKRNQVGGNYCTWCGAGMFEIGSDAPAPEAPPRKPEPERQPRRKFPLKWAIVAALAAAAAAGGALAYTQTDLLDAGAPSVLQDSRCGLGLVMEGGACTKSACGEGTILDEESGSCVAPPCGPGLSYNPASGACIVPP